MFALIAPLSCPGKTPGLALIQDEGGENISTDDSIEALRCKWTV